MIGRYLKDGVYRAYPHRRSHAPGLRLAGDGAVRRARRRGDPRRVAHAARPGARHAAVRAAARREARGARGPRHAVDARPRLRPRRHLLQVQLRRQEERRAEPEGPARRRAAAPPGRARRRAHRELLRGRDDAPGAPLGGAAAHQARPRLREHVGLRAHGARPRPRHARADGAGLHGIDGDARPARTAACRLVVLLPRPHGRLPRRVRGAARAAAPQPHGRGPARRRRADRARHPADRRRGARPSSKRTQLPPRGPPAGEPQPRAADGAHGAYRAAGDDRWIAIACRDDADWRRLGAALGDPPWARDPRFADVSGRRAHEDELDRCVEEATRTHDAWQLAERLCAAGVPAAPVADARDRVERDPQLCARGYFVPLPHAATGTWPLERPPFRLSDGDVHAGGTIRRGPPCLGEDTADVLRSLLGLGAEEIRALDEAQVLR